MEFLFSFYSDIFYIVKVFPLSERARNAVLLIEALNHPTQRNLLKILLNQTEIRLYLPFSD